MFAFGIALHLLSSDFERACPPFVEAVNQQMISLYLLHTKYMVSCYDLKVVQEEEITHDFYNPGARRPIENSRRLAPVAFIEEWSHEPREKQPQSHKLIARNRYGRCTKSFGTSKYRPWQKCQWNAIHRSALVVNEKCIFVHKSIWGFGCEILCRNDTRYAVHSWAKGSFSFNSL